MLGGVLVMLDANLPPSRARGGSWPALQAVAGFGLVIAGWWLRRAAMRPPDEPR
jgi:hypothetical protein